ncbi:MAG TPA: dihydrofolate reductase [Candidatus Lachnoclostridium stercoravium]|uniref:Dihydrofolate reductase n=1 Tax=Candidatus Lachnoclostridium stercoravium TaxID=2838633 RepID=A0A9D2HLA1_9FIRM|nr:dihydrofolate reductase [Candidatus Lachnoclostridium stercoravium]
MNIIVAADRKWAIGKQGGLLVSIPEDMRLFREETLGKVVVMGRKTLESLPGGQPLYGRTTIVLTRNPEYKVKGAIVCHSLEEALEKLKAYPSEDIFIAGGQSIYEQFLPYCDTAHVTYIDYSYEADTWFPDLDKDEDWKLALETEEETYFNLCYNFRMYKRKARG